MLVFVISYQIKLKHSSNRKVDGSRLTVSTKHVIQDMETRTLLMGPCGSQVKNPSQPRLSTDFSSNKLYSYEYCYYYYSHSVKTTRTPPAHLV